MPRPLKYPVKRTIALSEKTDHKLVKIAVKYKTTPAEYIRVVVEKSLQ